MNTLCLKGYTSIPRWTPKDEPYHTAQGSCENGHVYFYKQLVQMPSATNTHRTWRKKLRRNSQATGKGPCALFIWGLGLIDWKNNGGIWGIMSFVSLRGLYHYKSWRARETFCLLTGLHPQVRSCLRAKRYSFSGITPVEVSEEVDSLMEISPRVRVLIDFGLIMDLRLFDINKYILVLFVTLCDDIMMCHQIYTRRKIERYRFLRRYFKIF